MRKRIARALRSAADRLDPAEPAERQTSVSLEPQYSFDQKISEVEPEGFPDYSVPDHGRRSEFGVYL